MSIELKITDPQSHGVLELRAIADFFSKLAAEKEGCAGLTREPRTAEGAQAVKEAIIAKAAKLGLTYACKVSRDENGTHMVDPAPVDRTSETDAERIKRLHGNVASAGGDTDGPLTAAKVFGGDAPKPTATDAVAPVAPQAPSAVAPVAPTAPVPTAPIAPAPSSGIVTDKAGLPHDKRIHSTPPSINKGDGLWRAKRGRDEIEAKRIEAELLQLMAVPVATAPVATDAPKPDLDPSATAAPAPVAPQAPTAPVAPTASAPASTGPKNLGELMTWAQAEVAAGRIESLEAVRLAAVAAGVAALPLLGTRPDLVPVVYAALGGV